MAQRNRRSSAQRPTRRSGPSKTRANGAALVIVESPAKARTVSRFLEGNYRVKASIGHVRDLPKSKLGVDIEHDFAPSYLVLQEKRAVVAELRDEAAQATRVYLATDPDREGEAIAWHLVEALKLDRQAVQRVVFHEITPEAVREAFAHPRGLDLQLVDAQQARRILDRLFGYQLSPLLWKKVRGGLSAGRVQSAALKMVVDREREVRAFVPQEYWTIEVTLGANGATFTAVLVADAESGERIEIPNEAEAQRYAEELREAVYTVHAVRRQERSRQPPPPFITSTLQQDASRQLRLSPQRTMAVAQQLYEGLPIGTEGNIGLITYMRTDSTNVASSAQEEARAVIAQLFGRAYLPARPRVFRSRVKGAQEAHEAIRPTGARRRPEAIVSFLDNDQARLYELIWKRFIASQMAAARMETTTVEVVAVPRQGGRRYLLRASATQVRFPGYLAVYQEASDDEEEEARGDARTLAALRAGMPLTFIEVQPRQHFTQPPPRYTEASLIKALEEKGIGRPSTYATILSTLLEREYVRREARHLVPTPLGELVRDLLTEHFPNIVDEGFTARMEEELDEIARGEKQWVPVVREFYDPFSEALRTAQRTMEKVELPEETTDERCPECGRPMVVKRSRFGRFLGCSGYPECKATRPLLARIGVACPQCGRDLIQRRSRGRGRLFYGCSGYPDCTFITNRRPLPQRCPSCGGLLVQASTRNAECLGCKKRVPLDALPDQGSPERQPVSASQPA